MSPYLMPAAFPQGTKPRYEGSGIRTPKAPPVLSTTHSVFEG